MKIAMMTNNYKPFVAGVPISVERLSDGLRANGHEVVVFAPDYEGQEEDEHIVRYRALIKGIVNGFSVPNSFDPHIERCFRKGCFDVIHVHHPMLIGRTALYLSKKYHVPLCFTYHTRYEQYLHYIGAEFIQNAVPDYVNRFAEKCDLVFAPTQSMQDYLEKSGLRRGTAVLPTGLSKESFAADEEEAAYLRELLLGGRKYLFCTVSRLAKEKNLGFLFHALAERKKKHGADFRLALVGEGPYRGQLCRLAEELGIREDTQGIVLLEAMAAATPVLAVKAPGVRDVVVNGKNGYMTYMSEMEFENRLNNLLNQDRTYLERGALETAEKYEMQEIAKWATVYYNIAIRNHDRNSNCEREGKRLGSVSYFNCRG